MVYTTADYGNAVVHVIEQKWPVCVDSAQKVPGKSKQVRHLFSLIDFGQKAYIRIDG